MNTDPLRKRVHLQPALTLHDNRRLGLTHRSSDTLYALHDSALAIEQS